MCRPTQGYMLIHAGSKQIYLKSPAIGKTTKNGLILPAWAAGRTGQRAQLAF